jgi:outer membrane usher protein FimD/PapC
VGFLREKFATESNRYSRPAAVAYHRYGLSDYFTLGFRGEATNDVFNAGPQTAVCLWSFGILNLSLSGSGGNKTGYAADISYSYQNGRYNTRLFYQYFSNRYGLIASNTSAPQQNYSAGADFGYTHPTLGSLSLDLSTQKTYDGTKKNVVTLGYSRNFFGSITFNTTFSMTRDSVSGNSNSFNITLTYTPKTNMSISARHELTEGKETESVQIQKNPPLGEGIGYRALVQRDKRDGQNDAYTVNPMIQLNGRHGILRGEISASQDDGRWGTQNQLSLSGALVVLDGMASLTRPVTDSFAMVKVGDIEGVTVRTGGQDIGKTDSSGKVLLTNISSYNYNLISINDKDIPIEYYYPVSQKYVSPPLRGGACIGFVVKRMQPVTGSLHIRINGELKPVEFFEGELQVDGRTVAFPTGKGGEFYIDISQTEEFKKNAAATEKSCSSVTADTSAFLKHGTYHASIPYDGKRHTFQLTIPDSTDPIIDLGQVVFDATP